MYLISCSLILIGLIESYRKQLHEWFDLPLDRPIFRRPNKFWFDEDYQNQRQLINTHVGLNMSGGEISVVQGRYAYHHYMQDNFDDNGWGCAYRSLQTIISWFKYVAFKINIFLIVNFILFNLQTSRIYRPNDPYSSRNSKMFGWYWW